MVNKKIKAIAKIERDAQNNFFVKMLYGLTNSKYEPETVFQIEDIRLIDTLITLSNKAIEIFQINNVGTKIVIYEPKTKHTYSGYNTDYTIPSKIIVGTVSSNEFEDINYLVHMMSYTMKKHDMGELWIQYENKLMSEEEFYEFQKELSI